ncbi:MAG TPA: mechanosensitive ion channel domain-containing protein [Candidatus Limnocylindria bacterium]|nr:mechanosensitive ion channel domain-containing protein [Candidatus Limnocylindria bacterium]
MDSNPLSEKSAESLRQSQTLKRLEQAAANYSRPDDFLANPTALLAASKPKSGWWFIPYLAALGVLVAIRFVLDWAPLGLSPGTLLRIHAYLVAGTSVVSILAGAKAIDFYVINRISNPVSRFNLKRIAKLAVGIVLVFVVISILFVNWYAAVVSLGLISLVLGFALQTPISSFVAWIYILLRAPYRVGDRIEIGEARGDVIDVSYLDTTIWEIGGRHLTTDHPSGRLVKFPNTNVFSTPVINYSWPLFPYIWNEIVFEVAYESDFEFIAQTMEAITTAEVGESMSQKVHAYRELLSATPVHHLEVRDRPVVLFRPNPNTWVEAIVQYLVDPKSAGQVKNDLTRKLLVALNAAPDKVLFPKGNAR